MMVFQDCLSRERGSMDSKELLRALQQGDQEAFDTLYFLHWEEVYESGFRWTKDPEIVKDALQEVFTSIWLNRKRPIDNFDAYLKIAIRNRIFKVLQKSKGVDPLSQALDNSLVSDMVADRNIRSHELLSELERALCGLPPQRQKIVRLRYLEDFSTRSIAEMMGITQKTVQNQLTRAVASMKLELLQVTLLGYFVINIVF